ncbi:hypothetical protein D3C80_1071240 [compost metagenome]
MHHASHAKSVNLAPRVKSAAPAKTVRSANCASRWMLPPRPYVKSALSAPRVKSASLVKSVHRAKSAAHVKNAHRAKSERHVKNAHHVKSVNHALHAKSASLVQPNRLRKPLKSNCQTKSCCRTTTRKAPKANAHVAAPVASVAAATVASVSVMPTATSLKAAKTVAKKATSRRAPNWQPAWLSPPPLRPATSVLKPKLKPTLKLNALLPPLKKLPR